MPAAGLRRLGRDELDEVGNQRQPIRTVGRKRRIRGLPHPGHVADERDRPGGIVDVLVTPGPDRRVVHGAIERQIELHVPLEVAERPPPAADPLAVPHPRIVRDGIGDHVPVPGRGLRPRAVRPELGDDALEVGAIDDVGRVGLIRHRVHGVAGAVVRAERVVGDRPGRDIDEHVLRCVDAAAQPDQLDHRVLHDLVARAAQPRLRTRVHGEPGRGIDVLRSQGERDDVRPAHADEFLDRSADRNAVLSHEEVERQRLPAVRIDDVPDTRQLEDQLGIDGRIAGVIRVATALALVRTVGRAIGDHRGGDPVPERRGGGPVRRGECPVVAERIHPCVERRFRDGGVRMARIAVAVQVACGEAVFQQAVGREADGLLTRRLRGRRPDFLFHQVAARSWRVGRPRVPHRDRKMEEIAGMNRRLGDIDADGVEQLLVPLPRHARPALGVPVSGGSGSNTEERNDQDRNRQRRSGSAGHGLSAPG